MWRFMRFDNCIPHYVHENHLDTVVSDLGDRHGAQRVWVSEPRSPLRLDPGGMMLMNDRVYTASLYHEATGQVELECMELHLMSMVHCLSNFRLRAGLAKVYCKDKAYCLPVGLVDDALSWLMPLAHHGLAAEDRAIASLQDAPGIIPPPLRVGPGGDN